MLSKYSFSPLLLAMSLFAVVGCSAQSGDNAVTANTQTATTIKPVAVPAGFIKGMDVSMLPELEQHGATFFNEQQQPEDAMQILKAHGVNYIRARVWVDPKSADGTPYGGGDVDLTRAIAIAKRAKALDMKFLLDIHYSDFWTDPRKQMKPKAWAKLSFPALVKQVHDYTRNVLNAYRKAGVMPDMVQVGNELNSGMLWPDGKSWGGDGHEFERLAKLLNAGIKGVRESYPQGHSAPIMLHLAEGGKNDTFRWWFDGITKNGVTDYDIIGMSYYPYWHGPLAALKANMADVTVRYHKPVIVVETAYPFTSDNGDTLPNYYAGDKAYGDWPVSVAGQAKFLTDLMSAVAAVPNQQGLGIFYWEPEWIPTAGTTWATPAGMKYGNDMGQPGNGWENQALFDFEGHVLPSLRVFGIPQH